MKRQQLSTEQKRLDVDLWIIALVTFGVFLVYATLGNQIEHCVTADRLSIVPRLLLTAAVQFGIAGLGVTMVCIMRKEHFTQFGLKRKNSFRAILWTIPCFLPSVCYIVLSGQFNGYHPFHIMITDDVIASGFPFSVIGMAIIIVVWGLFEGFNYVVICDKINRRYPRSNQWFDYGAITCAVVGILFHPLSISFWGIVEIITTFLAIYGMLLVKKKIGNAWGCIFAFCFIWNAL